LLRQRDIQTVAHAGEHVLVAEAATILEARRAVREQRPDGRVLDIGIPDGRVDGAQAFSKSGSKRKLLVLTSLHASPAPSSSKPAR
jgi:DNA-binding NarL/FixJ family response regulator